MSILGDALLAGAVGGLNQYAKQRKEEEDEREAALAAAAERNYNEMRENLKANQQAKPYTYETMQDGKRGKVTRMPTFDPRTGERTDIDLGFAPIQQKAPTTRNVILGESEATQQWNPETGQFETIGTPGPRFKPNRGGSGGGEKAPQDVSREKPTSLSSTEIEALFGKVDENGVLSIDNAEYRRFLEFQRVHGIPNAQRAAQLFKTDFSNVDSGANTAPLLQNATGGQQPGSSQANPIPAQMLSSEPPPGTWVKLPDGRVIQTGR